MGLPYPKQLLNFNGKPLIAHVVSLFQGLVHQIIVPTPIEYINRFQEILGSSCKVIPGGATRFESVKKGFESIDDLGETDLIIIHDAARPFFNVSTLPKAIQLAGQNGALIYASKATDTIKEVSNELNIIKTHNRDYIFLAQTPQIFNAGLLKKCYEQYKPSDHPPTDEAAMFEHCGLPVKVFLSKHENPKITMNEDLKLIQSSQQRIGHGYDVHRFEPTRPLILCGVTIPDSPGLLGHSDADVALHAVIDAILGACAMGDIGRHFPDHDPEFKGISSVELLGRVLSKTSSSGFNLINIDLTIQAQIPKLSPFINQMIESLSKHIGLPPECVNVKATTTEGLGFIGEKKGIAAHSVVLMEKGVSNG